MDKEYVQKGLREAVQDIAGHGGLLGIPQGGGVQGPVNTDAALDLHSRRVAEMMAEMTSAIALITECGDSLFGDWLPIPDVQQSHTAEHPGQVGILLTQLEGLQAMTSQASDIAAELRRRVLGS